MEENLAKLLDRCYYPGCGDIDQIDNLLRGILNNSAILLINNNFVSGLCNSVVCWELGFDYGYAYDSAYYGEGEGDILLDDVYCDGWEWSLDECSFETTHNCGHYEDVGIECYGKINLFNHFLVSMESMQVQCMLWSEY